MHAKALSLKQPGVTQLLCIHVHLQNNT